MPVARATAAPPLEPPQVSAGFHGLRVAPKTALKVLPPAPNSGVLVLPTTIAPAALSRWTTSASSSGTSCSWTFEPHVVRMPLVGVRSLIETGTPWSGGATGGALERGGRAPRLRERGLARDGDVGVDARD